MPVAPSKSKKKKDQQKQKNEKPQLKGRSSSGKKRSGEKSSARESSESSSTQEPLKKKRQKESKAAKDERPAKLPKREVIYPEVELNLCAGEESLTAEQAKALLGWQEESENIKLRSNEFVPLIKNHLGIKVRLNHNLTNRPLYSGIVDKLMQEILNGNWRFNGEPIIVGNTGMILDGQHTLISLILAAAKWHEKSGQYKDKWKTEPTIDKLIVYGVSEEDSVVNTINTGKERSFYD